MRIDKATSAVVAIQETSGSGRPQTLRITGNVMVVSATSTVGGPDLVIDLNADTTVFQGGGSSGRVTGVFTTQ